MAGKQPRAKVRLRVDRGTAMLKQLGISSVMCAMLDVSENGCLCRISLADAGDETAAAWRNLINPGRVLLLEVTDPPELRHLQFNDAEVRWVKAAEDAFLDFGILLRNIDPEQALTLGNAMMTFAANKLRKVTSPTGTPPQQQVQDVAEKRAALPPTPAKSAAATTIIDAFPPPRTGRSSARMKAQPAENAAAKLSAPGRGRLGSGRLGQFAEPGERAPSSRPLPLAWPGSESAHDDGQKRQAVAALIFYQFRDSGNQPLDSKTYQGIAIDFTEGAFQIEGPLPGNVGPQALLEGRLRLLGAIQTGGYELAAKFHVHSVRSSPRGEGLHLLDLRIAEISENDRRTLRELYIRAGLSKMNRSH